MPDTFVDVTYRGLEVGKRLKLRDVRAEVGYLEVPLPMPVGTRVSIDTGEGVTIEAFVTSVHEQIGGSDAVPGMKVRPTLAGKSLAWWQARVDAAASAAEAEADAKAAEASRKIAEAAEKMKADEDARAKAVAEAEAKALAEAEAAAKVAAAAAAVAAVPVAIAEAPSKKNGKRNGKRGRSETGSHEAVEEPPSLPQGSGRATMVMSAEAVKAALAAADVTPDDGIVDDGKRTEMMAAVDPEAIEAAEAAASAAPVVQEKRTTVMDAIDISMITGEPTTDIGAGSAAADDDDAEITIEAEDGDDAPSASGSMPAVGNGKPRKSGKRRKKR